MEGRAAIAEPLSAAAPDSPGHNGGRAGAAAKRCASPAAPGFRDAARSPHAAAMSDRRARQPRGRTRPAQSPASGPAVPGRAGPAGYLCSKNTPHPPAPQTVGGLHRCSAAAP